MYQYDVETFMCACDRKGLAAKTMKSYEQTLRLFGLFLAERGITQTEGIRHAQRIGLKEIHPHCFRNNFAKRFLMNGGDIYTLSRLLGHSSVIVTERAYLDVDTDDLHSLYQKYSPMENMGM